MKKKLKKPRKDMTKIMVTLYANEGGNSGNCSSASSSCNSGNCGTCCK